MAKNTRSSKKLEEIQDFVKDLKAENVRQNPVDYNGEKKRCRFLTIICADYGTFTPGEIGEIPAIRATELAALGKCEIIEEATTEAGA